MARQFGTSLRNAMADSYENHIGAAPVLEIRTGAPPANPATADSGTLIASATLPSDWLTAAASGAKSKNGTWTVVGLPAAGGGTAAGHFRLKQGATCHDQGTVTVTGGGGDMTLNNVNIANGQSIDVSSFSLTIPLA